MKRLLRSACLGAVLACINTGCTNVDSVISNINRETPYSASTNLTETLKCIGMVINESESRPILFLVDDFFDGTVPIVTDAQAILTRAYRSNGPLADGGKYDFEAVIKRTVSSQKIVLPYALPTGVIQHEDIYGRLKPEYLQDLLKIYNVSGVVRVKGVFTQNDSADYINNGSGNSIEQEGKRGRTEIEYGLSEASKSVSLAIYLGSPLNNTLIAATTLTLNMHTMSDEFSVGFGYGEGSMSFVNESKIKEGLHGSQRTLIEAAAMWILRGLYSKLDFSQCVAGGDGEGGAATPDATIAANERWLSLDPGMKIKYLKLMLRELEYYNGSISDRYDIPLQKAIAAYEADSGIMIPHTKHNLGDLFISLYGAVEIEEIDRMAKHSEVFFGNWGRKPKKSTEKENAEQRAVNQDTPEDTTTGQQKDSEQKPIRQDSSKKETANQKNQKQAPAASAQRSVNQGNPGNTTGREKQQIPEQRKPAERESTEKKPVERRIGRNTTAGLVIINGKRPVNYK
ncbi:MAG: hypothetical protein ACL93V_08715 [Candidatus Electrothrix sp. YB6]